MVPEEGGRGREHLAMAQGSTKEIESNNCGADNAEHSDSSSVTEIGEKDAEHRDGANHKSPLPLVQIVVSVIQVAARIISSTTS